VKHTDTLYYRKKMLPLLRKQDGLTLIELLITLAILSFTGSIVWSVFFQGINFSQTSISKNTIQQETNLIITNLKKIHQTSKEYTINNGTCTITVNATKADSSTQTYVFDHPSLCFQLDYTGLVQPDNEDVKLTITTSEKNDTNNKLEIKTILFRLKDGGI
jgi:prepilin-type N-terminal cleavage/methylation domain-containing protein